jgi:type IV fimbrial biogenesis protein FimT
MPNPGDRQAGLTVIEVVVSALIVVLLVGIVTPSVQEYRHNGRLNAVSAEFMAAVQLARTEAVRRQKIVSMCATDDATKRSPKCAEDANFQSWMVFEDGDGDCLPVAGEVPIQATSAIEPDEGGRLAARANGFCVSFAVNGTLRAVPDAHTADKLLVCDARGIGEPFGNDPSPSRGIVIDPRGRVTLTRQRDTIRGWRLSCPFGNH